MFELLRAHQVIVKVSSTHRYHLSAAGKRIAATLLTAHTGNANRFITCLKSSRPKTKYRRRSPRERFG